MSKSKLGQKHLDAYPTPDDFKTTLPSYAPKPAAIAPAAPVNTAPSADFRYDPKKGTLNPTTLKPAFPTF